MEDQKSLKENNFRDLLIELRTQSSEVLRRMDSIDRNLVPRSEYATKMESIDSTLINNQKDIKSLEKQNRNLIWRVATGLGSLQVISTLVLYMATK